MRILLLAVIVLAGTGLFVFAWGVMRRRAMEARLRANPPQLDRFVVRLSSDSEKTNVKMTRFFSRLEKLLPQDDESLQQNKNIVHFTLIGVGQSPGQSPKVRFLVHCPPELTEVVQRELADAYGDDAQMLDLKDADDPFLTYQQAVRDHRDWQLAQQAEAPADE